MRTMPPQYPGGDEERLRDLSQRHQQRKPGRGDPHGPADRARLKKNLPINFYLSDTSLIDDYSTDPSRVRAERQLLPIAVDPHTSRTVVLLADPDALSGGRSRDRVIRDQLAFCSYVKSDDANALRHPELKLGMKWTGLVLAGRIRDGLAQDDENVTLDIAGNKLTQPSWRAELVGPMSAPRAVMFRHRLAEASTGGIAKMSVYGHPRGGGDLRAGAASWWVIRRRRSPCRSSNSAPIWSRSA